MRNMKKNILILGAGRSSASLVEYLLNKSRKGNWQVLLADRNLAMAGGRISGHERGKAYGLNLEDENQTDELFAQAHLVISMLPADYHVRIAKLCLKHNLNMLTASYISSEMKALDDKVKTAGLTFLNELGVDPGIDHISAMKVIDGIRSKGGKITEFETFTGGLVAPEFDDNPWNYKFTWNPRNVVLAGSGGAVKFIEKGQYKYIPYHKLFRRTEPIEIDEYGKFEGYANRDSLKYRSDYGLEDISTMYRGTLRRPGFCRAWDTFVQLGATDDSYVMENVDKMTFRQFINSFLKYNVKDSVELKLMHYMKVDPDDEELMNKLKWLDIFEDIPIGLKNATPAQILEHILERKWKLKEDERDMIVMWHKFRYQMRNKDYEMQTSMVVEGDDNNFTAMAKTVGLPLAIGAKLMLEGKINKKGVIIPIYPEIYNPILNELEENGISFKEKKIRH